MEKGWTLRWLKIITANHELNFERFVNFIWVANFKNPHHNFLHNTFKTWEHFSSSYIFDCSSMKFFSDFWETDRPNSIWYTASSKGVFDMVELFKKGSRFTKSYHLRYANVQVISFESIQMTGEVVHLNKILLNT